MVRTLSVTVVMALFALAWAAAVAMPAHAAVVLNEVSCEDTDWVEIVNTGSEAEDVGGWLLTDDPADADPPRADHRYELPTGSEIAPGAPLVVERGDDGFPFGISCGNDTVRLADVPRTGVETVVVPGLSAAGRTWGRYPNGVGGWTETKPTGGAANEPADDDPDRDDAAWLFDPEKVVGIDLSISEEDREELARQPDEYVDAEFSLRAAGGTYGPMAIGLRLKGSVSFRDLDGKAAFKLKFDHSVPGQRLLGLEKLTLNNMVQDPSQMHEVLAYETFRAAGIPAPRVGYGFVTVDGAPFGVYANVETPDEVMLRKVVGPTRHMLEGEVGADVTAAAAGEFEIDEGSESDLSDLEALIAAAAADGPLGERMAPVADLGEMATMWAVERYIGHYDGYSGPSFPAPNNFYLHSDPAGRFRMLPWGTDQTWTERLLFVEGRGTLFTQCLGDDACFGAYREAVEGLPAIVDGLSLDAKIAAIATVLRPWQEIDPRREHSMDEIDAAVEALPRFIAARAVDVGRPVFWGLPDTTPPETELISAPDGVIRPRVVGGRPLVRIRFRASQPAASFECRLDDARAYRPCDSPWRGRSSSGPHRFRVRAVDPAGNADATPAVATWRVRG